MLTLRNAYLIIEMVDMEDQHGAIHIDSVHDHEEELEETEGDQIVESGEEMPHFPKSDVVDEGTYCFLNCLNERL